MKINCIILFFIGCISLSVQAQSRDNQSCGIPVTNAYGPYDYTNPDHFQNKLGIVEGAHFTRSVERLVKGNRGTIEADIDYTLRAFPNHHRALFAMSKYLMSKPPGYAEKRNLYTMECYLKRALFINSKDSVVYMLYGLHLHQSSRILEAEEMYQKVISLNDRYSEAYYNLGLLYLELGKIEDAQSAAKKAYELGYPLKGLKEKLKKLKDN